MKKKGTMGLSDIRTDSLISKVSEVFSLKMDLSMRDSGRMERCMGKGNIYGQIKFINFMAYIKME